MPYQPGTTGQKHRRRQTFHRHSGCVRSTPDPESSQNQRRLDSAFVASAALRADRWRRRGMTTFLLGGGQKIGIVRR
jgi:hypothetical protein